MATPQDKHAAQLKLQLLDYLITTYQAEVVILTGSRAAGTHREDSDWDLFVVGNSTRRSDTSIQHGQFLDVEIKSRPIDENFIVSTGWSPVHHATVWLDDSSNTGACICRNTAEAYARGPLPLSLDERQRRLAKLTRLQHKIIGSTCQPLVQYYHLGFFYELSIRYWFELQRTWSVRIDEATPLIQEQNPEFFAALEVIAMQSSNHKALKESILYILDKLSSFA